MSMGDEHREPEQRQEPEQRPEPEGEVLRLNREEIVSERVFGVIYGAIAVGVLLAGERPAHEPFGAVVASIAVALVLYWLAHSYALLTVRRLREGRKLTPEGLAQAMFAELWIVIGGVEPLVVLVVFVVLGAKVASAETAAIWATAVLVLTIEVVTGIRAHLTGPELFMQALLGAGLGSLVIALSAVLH